MHCCVVPRSTALDPATPAATERWEGLLLHSRKETPGCPPPTGGGGHLFRIERIGNSTSPRNFTPDRGRPGKIQLKGCSCPHTTPAGNMPLQGCWLRPCCFKIHLFFSSSVTFRRAGRPLAA